MKILFQGDSITDCDRVRSDEKNMGTGYPLLVKSELGFEFPGKYEFINKGIGGNRIVDLYARIKSDIINLKPDVISILIGVNDVWHELDFENGIDAKKYFKIYSMLIDEVKEALPNIEIIIMEPFTLKGTGNEKYYAEFEKEVRKRAEKSRLIAEKYGLTFIELQNKFDKYSKLAPNFNWLKDGVHPSEAGHEIIKREWIKTFKDLTGINNYH